MGTLKDRHIQINYIKYTYTFIVIIRMIDNICYIKTLGIRIRVHIVVSISS